MCRDVLLAGSIRVVESGHCILSSVVPVWRGTRREPLKLVVPITYAGTEHSTLLCLMHWLSDVRRTAPLCRGGQAADILERGGTPVHLISRPGRQRQRRGYRMETKRQHQWKWDIPFSPLQRRPVDMGVGSDMVENGGALVPGTAWCCDARWIQRCLRAPSCFWIGACRRRKKGLIRRSRATVSRGGHGITGWAIFHLQDQAKIRSKLLAFWTDDMPCGMWTGVPAVQVVLRYSSNLVFA